MGATEKKTNYGQKWIRLKEIIGQCRGRRRVGGKWKCRRVWWRWDLKLVGGRKHPIKRLRKLLVIRQTFREFQLRRARAINLIKQQYEFKKCSACELLIQRELEPTVAIKPLVKNLTELT